MDSSAFSATFNRPRRISTPLSSKVSRIAHILYATSLGIPVVDLSSGTNIGERKLSSCCTLKELKWLMNVGSTEWYKSNQVLEKSACKNKISYTIYEIMILNNSLILLHRFHFLTQPYQSIPQEKRSCSDKNCFLHSFSASKFENLWIKCG